MNLYRKILCKLGYHKEELFPVTVQPIVKSIWPQLDDFPLPKYDTYMWKCEHCNKERIIYK